ncbi:MAG: hypothetical protein AAGF78_00180 [Pseudomonadota bacterium]
MLDGAPLDLDIVTHSSRAALPPTAELTQANLPAKSTLGHAPIDDLRGQGHSVTHVPQSPEEALDPPRSLRFFWQEAERAAGTSCERKVPSRRWTLTVVI